MVEYEGYILQVSFPVELRVSPLMARHATSSPEFLPVPRSSAKDLENSNSIVDVILLLAEFS